MSTNYLKYNIDYIVKACPWYITPHRKTPNLSSFQKTCARVCVCERERERDKTEDWNPKNSETWTEEKLVPMVIVQALQPWPIIGYRALQLNLITSSVLQLLSLFLGLCVKHCISAMNFFILETHKHKVLELQTMF